MIVFKTIVTTLAVMFLLVAGFAVGKNGKVDKGVSVVGITYSLILCAAVAGMWL